MTIHLWAWKIWFILLLVYAYFVPPWTSYQYLIFLDVSSFTKNKQTNIETNKKTNKQITVRQESV